MVKETEWWSGLDIPVRFVVLKLLAILVPLYLQRLALVSREMKLKTLDVRRLYQQPSHRIVEEDG